MTEGTGNFDQLGDADIFLILDFRYDSYFFLPYIVSTFESKINTLSFCSKTSLPFQIWTKHDLPPGGRAFHASTYNSKKTTRIATQITTSYGGFP